MAGRRVTRGPSSRKLEAAGFTASIGSKKVPPVILITGDDTFSRETILETLRRELLPEGLDAFNYTTVTGEQVAGGELVNMAEVLPMGGDHRLIVVRRADKIPQGEVAAIAAYAASPTPSSVLVLVCDAGRAPILTALSGTAALVDCPAPRDYQLARWLEQQARFRKIPLEAEAARFLASILGEDHVSAISHLERAALLAKGPITRRVIEAMLPQSKDTNRFHFGDAVLSREPARAVKILRDLYEAGENGYTLLGLFEGRLRKALAMRTRVSAGESPDRVVQSVSPKLPPSVRAAQVRQLASFDEDQIIGAFRIARETDRAIKSRGSGTELAHMESMIWRIMAL